MSKDLLTYENSYVTVCEYDCPDHGPVVEIDVYRGHRLVTEKWVLSSWIVTSSGASLFMGVKLNAAGTQIDLRQVTRVGGIYRHTLGRTQMRVVGFRVGQWASA